MKFKEVMEKKNITVDDKARRRLNVSNKVANITADEIEGGVSIERLEALNVPVYRYGGQITIHGKLPYFSSLRLSGYKVLIKNNNGSVGVKYVGIDNEKKSIINDCICHAKPYKMQFHRDSQGVTLIKSFRNKDDMIALYNEIPDLYIGSKYMARGAYGQYYTCIDLMAIYETKLWQFCKWVSGIGSQSELDAIKTEAELQREKEKQERDTQRHNENERIVKARKEFVNLINSSNLKPVKDWKTKEGIYTFVKDDNRVKTYRVFNDNGTMKFENSPNNYGSKAYQMKGFKCNEMLVKDTVAVYNRSDIDMVKEQYQQSKLAS